MVGRTHRCGANTATPLLSLQLFLVFVLAWLGGAGRLTASGLSAGRASLEVWQPADWELGAVPAILQTQDGYLWLASYHGLARFDGVRFRVFDSANTPGLTNGVITSLYEDREGVLWIGHETGNLTRFLNGIFDPVTLGPKWPGGAIEEMAGDEDGDLWLLSNSGRLFRVRDGKLVDSPGGGATPSQKAVLTHSRNGKLWLTCNGAVARLERGAAAPTLFPEEDGTTGFYERVLPAWDGGLWVLGNGRLRKWRTGRWVAEMPGCPREPGVVMTLLELRSGGLLAATLKNGLYLLQPGTEPLHFSRTNGLSHDWVRSLCEDHEGNIWLGTGARFDGLRARKITMLTAPDVMQGCAVLSFAVCPDGSAWVGTEGAGLYHYNRGAWSWFREANGLPNPFVWSVLQTRSGELLVGTWGGGLLVKHGDRFESAGELAKVEDPAVSLYEDKQGALWIGTIAGLHRYEKGRLVWSAGKDKLSVPDVRAITEGPDGTLWFGMSGGGLGTLRNGTLKQYRKNDGVGSDFVSCLLAEPDGCLWFGTADEGLGRLKDGRFSLLGVKAGIPARGISHIVEDGTGNLWMGSERGVLRASKAELHGCADGAIPAIHCLSFGKPEGLASLRCSGGFQPGACRDAEGRLWFPTTKGLAVVDPIDVTTNQAPPPVRIEEVHVDDQTLDPSALASGGETAGLKGTKETKGKPRPAKGSALVIPPGHQRFAFHYTAPSFVAPDKVRFKYRLEGLEDQWSEASAQRMVEYSYLPPGEYQFRVIACNNDGVWNEEGATLAFTVLPTFWQTWEFRSLAALAGAAAVGAGVFGVARLRMRRRFGHLERQRAMERERARIARDIHDDLGASLTRITMLSQSVRGDLAASPQAATDLDTIYTTARELTRAMDEIVWAVNPKHDTLDSLVTYLGRFAQSFLSTAGLRCRLDVPLQLPPWALTSEIRHNVFLAFKEALHNVVKHARATEVRISLNLFSEGFALLIVDNGRGFNLNQIKARVPCPSDTARFASGNGLLNMQKRLEEAGGHCEWNTAPGEGTRVKLMVELASSKKMTINFAQDDV